MPTSLKQSSNAMTLVKWNTLDWNGSKLNYPECGFKSAKLKRAFLPSHAFFQNQVRTIQTPRERKILNMAQTYIGTIL